MERSAEIRRKLEARKRDLETAMQRLESDARNSGDADVQDEIDRVTTDEAKTTALDLNSREYRSLRQVTEALARLDDGTYGKCVICGKPIETVRLAAIPETPYCLEHADAEDTADSLQQPFVNS